MNKDISERKCCLFKMSHLRFMLTLRSCLLNMKYSRTVCSLAPRSYFPTKSFDFQASVVVRPQQICQFSLSANQYARRHDKTSSTVEEDLDDDDEKQDADDDEDSDQVIYRIERYILVAFIVE